MPRLGDDARRGLSRPGRLAIDAAGYGVGAVLAAVAGARGGKAVHPDGVVYRAVLTIDGAPAAPAGAQLLATPGKHAALLRFSRSVGVPRPIPDLLGIAVRVLDAYGPGRHQDLMTVSSVDRPVLHHVFVPATDFQQRVYSSSLPYRAGGETFLLGVVPDPSSPRPDGDDEFERLHRAAAIGPLAFGLAVAPVGGRFSRVGTFRVSERLPPELDALRFSPRNYGGGLEPAGVLNRLRDYAYPMSQAAWGARGNRAQRQHEADERVSALRASGRDGA